MSKIKASVVLRVTKDPETKSVGTAGKSITKINCVADSCNKKEGGGFDPIWITLALWSKDDGSLPGVIPYISKGSQLFVVGDFNVRPWTSGDKSGIEYSIEHPDITLVGAKVEREAAPAGDDSEDPFSDVTE